MGLKALMFAKNQFELENLKIYQKILTSNNQSNIKKLGSCIKGFDEKIWELWKYKIVVNGNYLNFSQNEQMKKILIDTADRELVEASPYDKIWGIGLNEHDLKITNKKNGV
ncbi:Domain of unknown function (DUF1768)-containing protein [uncultured virus]|nr:Domain of unknown function (DUF1768)-containing protein [uncultured virus]